MIGRRPLVLLAGVLALSALALAGCGSSANSLTLYNGQHVQTTQALVAAFEKVTGIQVNVRSDDEDALVDEITTEGSASPADVIYTENSPALEYLQSEGLLAPVAPAALAHVPPAYSSPDGDWVGISARVSVLVYNPSLISTSELPQTASELASARYRGKLALAPGETDFQPIVTSYAHAYGQAATLRWLEALRQNAGSHVYPDNETITDEVNRGAVAFGVVNQYYWYRLRAELGAGSVHARIAFLAPRDPGYVLNVSGAAVLRSSSHRADAQRFLAFLVSERGQQIIAHSMSFEYPLSSRVPPAAGQTPLRRLQPYPISIAELGDGSSAIALLHRSGLL